MIRFIVACFCMACSSIMVAGCADTPGQRGPYHQYLHDHGLE